MRLKNYLFYVIILTALIFSCSINKKISSISKYKGQVEIKNSNDLKFKYYLIVDSFCNLRFKIYDLSGIKISEFILNNDSININYIIDNSYKSYILEIFNKFNREKCLKEIIYDIFNFGIFSDSVNFNKKIHCYNRNIVTSENIRVYEINDLKFNKVFSITAMDFYNKDFVILLNSGIKVKLKIFD